VRTTARVLTVAVAGRAAGRSAVTVTALRIEHSQCRCISRGRGDARDANRTGKSACRTGTRDRLFEDGLEAVRRGARASVDLKLLVSRGERPRLRSQNRSLLPWLFSYFGFSSSM
jgi:hypothetical protein